MKPTKYICRWEEVSKGGQHKQHRFQLLVAFFVVVGISLAALQLCREIREERKDAGTVFWVLPVSQTGDGACLNI